MAGLPWFKCASDVAGHPKVAILAAELGLPDALGVLVRAWCWTAAYAPDGRIPKRMASAFAVAAGGVVVSNLQGLLAALVSAGLLDETEAGYEVHDWASMQTAHAEKLERDRHRRRQERAGVARGSRDSPATVEGVSRDGRGSVAGKRERERETEKETHTPPRAREAGAADRAAIDADHPRQEHPLLDALVRALRSPTCKPLYPANGARASVEAAIASVGLETAIARVRAAWTPGRPWLTHYLEDIAPPTQRPAAPRGRPTDPRAAAAPSPPEAFDRRDRFDGPPT